MKKMLIVFLMCSLVSASSRAAESFDRKWEIYLIHHTHVDIGYTHLQEEVMHKQWQNLELALDLVEQTRDLPEAARFRWNPEALWVIETWLAQASPEQRARFVRAVQEGGIGLDALFANLLTELCRPEELMQSLSFAQELRKLTGAAIDSAMLTDIPGAPWGLVTALSQNGVKYLSWGPNRSHRIGWTLKEWGDRPFYWVSPSGKEKVLCFIHGQGYSWFHQLLNLGKMKGLFTPEKIFPYLKKLEQSGYPYAIIPIRYNIGSDNGPPDPEISQTVKEWNERYPEVQVRLTTVSQAFAEFERRYGNQLPHVAGDFTPYWSDGAASTAKETALVRQAAEKLTQVQTFWTLLRPQDFPAQEFHHAWNQILLFNEHTWGAWNSISAPDSALAQKQWEWKQQRALEASQQAEALFRKLFGEPTLTSSGREGETEQVIVDVINTHSFPVTGPVTVVMKNLPGSRVETMRGELIPSQVLSDGSLFFIAREVPGLGSRKYVIKKGEPFSVGKCHATATTLRNDQLELSLSPMTGAIVSIKRTQEGEELVNQNFRDQFNEYVYIRGRVPQWGRRKKLRPRVSFTVKESGPLLCRVEIEREVPGSNSLLTTLTMYDGLSRLDLENKLDRPQVRKKEGLHFAFPVNADSPRLRYDVAWGTVEADRDQLPGACKNYFTPLRWVDISGAKQGLLFVLKDAPLFEAGDITTDATRYGWLRDTRNHGVIYSYVMNNYWETNYKADQPGETTFRYSLFPHGKYEASANIKASLEVMQPLLAVLSSPGFRLPPTPLVISNPHIIIETVKPWAEGEGKEITLFNTSDQPQFAELSDAEKCAQAFVLKDGPTLLPLTSSQLNFAKHELIRLVCK